MARYRVTHVYQAYKDGVWHGPWTPGEEVELTAELAEWVNRDSPGTLTAVEDQDEKPAEREAKQPPNRSQKTRKTR